MIKRFSACAVIVALVFAAKLWADNVSPTELNQGARTGSVPVSQVAGWAAMLTDTDGAHGPMLAESDSGVVSGGIVVAPALITRTDQYTLYLGGHGTTVQLRFKYATAGTSVVGPTVQVFGQRLDGSWQRLVDSGGAHALALTVDTTNDVRDGTNSYTQPATIDAAGCYRVIASIQTAATGTGITGCAIQGTFY